jgi:two-component system sensor histidine kinase YesM
MPVKMTIFAKIVSLLGLLLVPIIVLYGYSNKVSVDVVEEELQSSNLSQLIFFLRQVDANVDQLAMFPVVLDSDPYVRDYMDGHYKTIFDVASAEARIAEKMSLQSVSSNWVNELSLYLPRERKVISSSIFASYDEASLRARMSRVWTFESVEQKGQPRKERFYRQIVTPAKAASFEQARSIMEVSFPVENMTAMLDQFKSGGHGDPFLYRPGFTPIYNSSSSRPLVTELLGKLPL